MGCLSNENRYNSNNNFNDAQIPSNTFETMTTFNQIHNNNIKKDNSFTTLNFNENNGISKDNNICQHQDYIIRIKEEEINKLNYEINKLKLQINQLNSVNENLKKEIENLKKENENLKKENDKKKDYENLKKEIENLKKENDNLKKENIKLKSNEKFIMDRKNYYEKGFMDYEKKIESLNKKEKEINLKNKKFITKELKFFNNIKKEEKKNKEILDKYENEKKELLRKSLENKNQYENKILQNKKEIENYIKKNKELEKELENKKQNEITIKNYENEKKELTKKYEELQKKYKNISLNSEPILVGLENIGATCYMNATLQCLSNTPQLTDYFLNKFKYEPNNKSKIMSNEYYKVVEHLWNKEYNNKYYSPHSFKEKLSRENPLFEGIAANDSKDLINFLLERLHSELNNVRESESNVKMNNFTNNQMDQLNEDKMLKNFIEELHIKFNSIISDLFYGVMETRSQCQKCKNIKYNFQIYSFVEFPLEQVNNYCFINGRRKNFSNNNKNPDVDLYECFEYHSKLDLMTGENQMYCNICNCSYDALYNTLLYSAPNFLIINLNRGRGAVYECKVNFPEQLNLFNFVIFKNGNTVFELYAVICHLGPSSMSGHFVAYCKNKVDKKWYLFNDAQVSQCKKQNEYQDGMPYILFYKVK